METPGQGIQEGIGILSKMPGQGIQEGIGILPETPGQGIQEGICILWKRLGRESGKELAFHRKTHKNR